MTNLELEDSEDLSEEEILTAIPTANVEEFKTKLKESLQDRKVESYAFRRKNLHKYCRVILTKGALVFQVDWIPGGV